MDLNDVEQLNLNERRRCTLWSLSQELSYSLARPPAATRPAPSASPTATGSRRGGGNRRDQAAGTRRGRAGRSVDRCYETSTRAALLGIAYAKPRSPS